MKTLADELARLKIAIDTPMGLTALNTLTLHRIAALVNVAMAASTVRCGGCGKTIDQHDVRECASLARLRDDLDALAKAFGCEGKA